MSKIHMNQHLKSYLNSFKCNKTIVRTLGIDLATILLLTLIFLGFAQILNAQAYAISDGKTPQELQSALLAGSVDVNKAFLSSIQLFVLTFAIGSTIILLGTLFLFSYSRYLIYSIIHKTQEKRSYWRWNILVITITIIGLLHAALFLLFKFLIAFLTFSSPILYSLATAFLTGLFLITYLLFTFTTKHIFSEKYRVFESIGFALKEIYRHKSKYLAILLFSLLTIILLSLLLTYLERPYIYLQTPLLIINSTIFFLFLNWLRKYTLEN